MATGNILSVSDGANTTRYVCDIETGLYYLQSRYYNPQIGRFLNADAYTSTGQGFSGNNTFVYCGNDPILLVDSSGTRHEISAGAVGPFDPDAYSAYRERQIYADEYAVLEGKTNKYKDVDIIRVDAGGTSSFSFGVIFLSDNIKANIDGVYLLRHEYGHTIQLKELGVIGYTLFVVTPSVNGFQKQAKNKLTIDYYSQPWEFEADLYGKVPTRDSYDPYVWDWLIDYRSYRSCFFDR